jgi:hypothetical protein
VLGSDTIPTFDADNALTLTGLTDFALLIDDLVLMLERVALNRFQSWLWLAAHNATTVMHVATRM